MAYCFRCFSSNCMCNRKPRVQPLAAPITEYPAKISSPKDVSNLQLWLRADLGVKRTGLTVHSWEDQSGNSRHFTAGGTPQFIPGHPDFNQKPVINMPGPGYYFTQSAWGPLTQPYTVFLVCGSYDSTSYGGYILSTQTLSPYDDLQVYAYRYSATGTNPIGLLGNSGNILEVYGAKMDASATHVYCFTVESATSTAIYVDGFTKALARNDIGAVKLQNMTLGGAGFGSDFKIAELAVYSGALSEANRGSVMRYLRERYATPTDTEGTEYWAVGSVAPSVTAISPPTGTVAGGTSVSITVDNSAGCTGASVGGVALTGFTIVDGTHVSGTTGVHVAGAVDVQVTNSAGTGTLSSGFTYNHESDTSCLSWYDTETTPVLSGSNVTSWQDKGPVAVNAIQGAFGYATPTWTASNASLNNKGSVNFSASTSSGLVSNGRSAAPTTITMYIVGYSGYNGAGVTNAYYYDWGGGNARTGHDFVGGPGFVLYDGATLSPGSIYGNTPCVICIEWDSTGGNERIFKNDPATPIVTGNAASPAPGTSGHTKLVIGNYAGAVLAISHMGSMAAFGVFSGIHSTAKRTAIINSLKSRYGIP